MKRSEKEKFIRSAYKKGITGRKICPTGNGNAFYNFLKRPQATTGRKIDEMYSNAVKELNKVSPNKKTKNATKSNTKKTTSIDEDILSKMQKQILSLEQKVRDLEFELKKIKNGNEHTKAKERISLKKDKIQGFNIRKMSTVTTINDKKYTYEKWYAIKRSKGKTTKILLGDVFIKEEAEKKIKSYLESR